MEHVVVEQLEEHQRGHEAPVDIVILCGSQGVLPKILARFWAVSQKRSRLARDKGER